MLTEMAKNSLIKISNGEIFLSPYNSFGVDKTTFPIGSLSFRKNIDFYLRVEGNYSNGELLLRIVDYNPTDITSFDNQVLKNEIKMIQFEKLNLQKFEKLLSTFKPHVLSRFSDSEEVLFEKNTIKAPIATPISIKKEKPIEFYVPNFIIVKQPLDTVYTETIQVSYTDTKFCLGYVEFFFKFKWYSNSIYFKIENHFILPQFNTIKNYFAKAISGGCFFTAQIKVTLRDGQLYNEVAISDDIDKINDSILESIKQARARKLTSIATKKGPRKSLYSADEIFAIFDDNSMNVFNQTESDLLNIFANTDGVRNKKQLAYLSDIKLSTHAKLRFTLKPLFGFLFIIEGNENYHCCWELLESHATYIWTFAKKSKSISSIFLIIDEEISTIQEIGRSQYRKEYRQQNIDKEVVFSAIDHKGISSMEANNFFNEWKEKFEKKFT